MTDLFICPVCGYSGLKRQPYTLSGGGTYDNCDCCNFEFGYDDDPSACGNYPDDYTREQMWDAYRKEWIRGGMRWGDDDPASNLQPNNYNPLEQLKSIGIELTQEDVDREKKGE